MSEENDNRWIVCKALHDLWNREQYDPYNHGPYATEIYYNETEEVKLEIIRNKVIITLIL